MDLQKIKDIYTSPDVNKNVIVGGWVKHSMCNYRILYKRRNFKKNNCWVFTYN
jgi:hypothetical protein